MGTNTERRTGSRYIYDLYYEKEAISKTLYDYLLKNGYADGNLIAKWKKQGYEKVRTTCLFVGDGNTKRKCALTLTPFRDSYAVYDVYKPKRPISMQHAYVGSRRHSSRRIKQSNV